MKNYKNFLPENFHFLVVKFSVCLNRHVFVVIFIYIVVEQVHDKTYNKTC